MDRALYAYNNSLHYVQAIQSYAALLTADARVFRGYYQVAGLLRDGRRCRAAPGGLSPCAGGRRAGPGSR